MRPRYEFECETCKKVVPVGELCERRESDPQKDRTCYMAGGPWHPVGQGWCGSVKTV